MSHLAYVGIDKDKLAKLIADGVICAADLRCLDRDTKTFLWHTCLWACKNKLNCSRCQTPCKAGMTGENYTESEVQTVPIQLDN
ncbi:hypothetical protein L2750_15520 [Shewanella submarina]|uniref:Uncharacterized protein n=1 Tax=Shewanella submarina TaxID=2016376 RepID=A0ABV7G9Z9_9GAMM|nr:hypothetical protein [Shewanella submarina]MCL1038543.1 hypothetical protein [Shewanella submarina]